MKRSVKIMSLALALIFALCALSAAAFTPDYYDYYYNRGYYSSVYPYAWTPYTYEYNCYYPYNYNYNYNYYYGDYNPYYYCYPYYSSYVYGCGSVQNIFPNCNGNGCGRGNGRQDCYYSNSYCTNSSLSDVISPCVNGFTLDIKALGLSAKKASSAGVVNGTNCDALRFDQMLVLNSENVNELVLTLPSGALDDNAAVGLSCGVESLQKLRNNGVGSLAFVVDDLKVGMTVDSMLVKAQDARTNRLFIQLDMPGVSDEGVKALEDRALDGEDVYRVSLYENASVKSALKKIGVLVEYVVSDSEAQICYYSNNKLVKPSASCNDALLYAVVPSGAPFTVIAD